MASDFREGLTMAYDTFKEVILCVYSSYFVIPTYSLWFKGIHDTVQTLHAAMEEDRACGGQWGMGILRHMTPSAIKPVVIVSRAAAQVLG
jgi:hypothetical protein